MAKQNYNPGMKLSGEYYKRALNHLNGEISVLKEQRHLSQESNKLYCEMEEALEEFKSTKLLGDALFCARVRG